jgi:hypothetical protein
MYKRYPLKYFGAFTTAFINRAMNEFQKHWLINRGNTTNDTLAAMALHTMFMPWPLLWKQQPVL